MNSWFPLPYIIHAINDQSQPDERKTDQPIRGKGFPENDQPDQELESGRNELQNSHRSQLNLSRSRRKKQKWNGGDDTGSHQNQI